MAAAFIHYFLGLGIAYLFGFRGIDALVIGLAGAIQDVDFVLIFLHKYMKPPFSRLLTHRGITHTFLFLVIVTGFIFVFSPLFSVLVFINFSLHIFADYATSWGLAPFLPFSDERYSLGLMTIFDVPLTVLSCCVGVCGFFSVNPLYFFAAFFGYIAVRFVLKQRLDYERLVPMGNFVYAFCYGGQQYTVGKVDVLGREYTMVVDKINSEIDPGVLERVTTAVEGSTLSHFLEYPVYTEMDDSIMVKDARSYLFPRSRRLFTVFFDKESERLYMDVGRRIHLD
jgi:membrane-bound metal-dependent hydrolase YbcI (DUF457 family)